MRGVTGYRDNPSPEWDPSAPIDLREVEEFLRLFHAENPLTGPVEPRLGQVHEEISATGTYVQTGAELTYGAQVAWRNSSKCIGRLYWRSLLVLDRRRSTAAARIFRDLATHLRIAGGTAPTATPGTELAGGRRAGQIRPVISIFPAAVPGRPYHRVWNEQLIRYAGYRSVRGQVVGDPRYIEFTTAVRRLGWRGHGGPFDVLPLVVQTPGEGVRLFELPEDTLYEVPLAHPEHRWFAELGLRWHAVPAVSSLRLSIGGLNYPLAPFNGWYMGTEIGARNLADPDRYNLLPMIAAKLGLDMSSESTLWRDRALVELNRAVLWSYERAGVRISDHHTESRRFLAHIERERRAGRPTPADWSWIVPPMSGAATAVFHRYYYEADQRPNFYLDAEARDLSQLGRVEPRRSSGPYPGPGAGRDERDVTLRPAIPEPVLTGPSRAD